MKEFWRWEDMTIAKALGERTALCLIIAFAGSCASAPSPTSSTSAQAISAADQQQIQTAKDEYRACLAAAAKFTDSGQYSETTLPRVITPMCYPQFARFETALMAGQPGDARSEIIRNGDQRQIDYAKEAIQQERGRTTVASSR